ncbi:MAG: hypothetical protein OSB43_12045, partial [Nocardioides sp.]|nr:hypothetical protein [Nocardioides sp.]
MATLVPLAIISSAWTVTLVASSSANLTPATGADPDVEVGTRTVPGGATVPARAIEAPASVSAPEEVSPGFEGTEAEIRQIVSTSST